MRADDEMLHCAAQMREAANQHLQGWNIRCNVCGKFGARWHGKRPGWGKLALCLQHCAEYDAEIARHEKALREFTEIKFEQPLCADRAQAIATNRNIPL